MDHEDGPADFSLNAKADVTVLVYNKGKVVANYALPTGGLNKDAIEKIVKSAEEMLLSHGLRGSASMEWNRL